MTWFDDLVAKIQEVIGTVNAVKDAIGNRVGSEASRIIGDIKGKVDEVRSRLQDFLHGLEDRVKFTVSNVQTRLGEGIDNAAQRVQQFVTGVQSNLKQAVDGVGDWLTARVEDTKRALANAVDFVRREVIDRVAATAAGITQAIGAKAQQVLDNVISVGSGIVTNLYHVATQISDKVGAAANSIVSDITASIQGILPGLADVMGGLVEMLRQKIEELLANIATVDDFVRTTIGIIREFSPQLEMWLFTAGARALGASVGGLLEVLEAEVPEGVDTLLSQIEAAPDVPPFIKAIAHDSHRRVHPGNWFILILLAVLSFLPFVGAIGEPGKEALLQVVWQGVPVRLVTVTEAADAAFRQQLPYDDYTLIAKKQGFDGAMAEILYNLREQYLGPGELVGLLRRGEISDGEYLTRMARIGYLGLSAWDLEKSTRPLWDTTDLRLGFLRETVGEGEHDSRLAQYGYNPEQIALRKQGYYPIPPAVDLIRFAVREVFDPAQRALLNLDADFPPAFGEWAKKQGLSEEWARAYWAAHWELPSVSQAFEMFHRGEISGEELAALLRAQDYAPVWRDKLTNIAYNPLTRVDIRRMYQTGVLTVAEVTQAYLAIGYSQENAERLTEFTVRLSSKEDAAEIEPFRSGLKGRLVAAYIDGTLTGDIAHRSLVELGYTEGQASAFVAEADFARQSELVQAVRAGVRKLYLANLAGWDTVVSRLGQVGIGSEELANLKTGWDIEKEFRDLSAAEIENRDLTKAEILTGYKDKVIKLEEATPLLTALGYDDKEVKILIAIANLQAAKAEATALRNAIKTEYLHGAISLAVASQKLDGLGYVSDYRDALLAEWSAKKIEDGARVPVATIRDLLNNDLLTEARARELLTAYNYPADVLEGVLALWAKRAELGGAD